MGNHTCQICEQVDINTNVANSDAHNVTYINYSCMCPESGVPNQNVLRFYLICCSIDSLYILMRMSVV